MIYCKTCKNFFDECNADKSKNTVPYGNIEVNESNNVECPYCSSNDLEFEVMPVTCECCGSIISSTDAFRDNDYYYCEYCYDNMEQQNER